MTNVQAAHRKISYAVRKGILKPSQTCERCGMVTKVDGHHDDYDKPLEVRWMCRKCHMNFDGRIDKLLASIGLRVFKAVITRDRNRGQLRLEIPDTYQGKL